MFVVAKRQVGAGGVMSVALVAICLGYFLVIVDSTIVTVALPALRRDLGAGLTGLQWVVDAYLLTFAAGLLGGGALGDRYGPRRVFLVGLSVFVAASTGCALAPGVATLVAARAVQGVGAALAVPTSLALLRVSFPTATARARAVGVWGGVAGVGAASGPILGGLLVDAVGWRWVFLVNLPLGLLGIWLTVRRLPADGQGAGRPLDPLGQLTGVLTLAGVAYALIEGPARGASAEVLVAASLAVLAGTGFVLAQRYGRAPMCELSVFASATFSGATLVGLLINLGFYGELFVLNLYLQQQLRLPPTLAGLAFLPQMGVVALGSTLSGRHTARAGGPRATMVIGLLVGGAGLLVLALAVGHGYPMLLLPLVAAGFGMSFTMPAATSAVLGEVPARRSGLAAGVINTARQVGGLVGVAGLGALVAGPGLGGYRVALAVASAAFLVGALLAVCTVRPAHTSSQ